MAEIRANLSDGQKLNNETGYLFDGNNAPTYLEGADNEAEIQLNVQGQIDGYIHSHFNNGENFPVFSPGDVLSLWELMQGNNIRKSEDFFMGMVSFTGDNFLLKINDEAKFEAYGMSYLSNLTIYQGYEGIYKSTYLSEDITKSTVDAGEIALLQFINGSGLKLYKSNSSMSKWQPRTMGKTGFPTKGNCN